MDCARKEDARRLSSSGLKILVVDDNDDTADSSALLLQLCGHTVRVARNGPEALRSAADDPPDVVLLDLGLPGLSGYEVARQLKRGGPWVENKDPLLIAISGYGQEEDRTRSYEAGIDLHLVKPPDVDALLRLLDRFQSVLQGVSSPSDVPVML